MHAVTNTITSTKQKRKAYSLIEMVVAMGLFAVVLSIVITLMAITTSNAALHNKSYSFFRGTDDFIYNLLIEAKSAEECLVEEDVLTLFFPDATTVIYRINNLVGEVTRNGMVCSSDFYAYYFIPYGNREFGVESRLTEEDSVSYVLYCQGAKEE